MTGRQTACEIVPFPQPKQQAIDWLELNRRRHMMYALLEVDITEARHAIRAYRARTAAPLSLTAFLIHCLAHAVDEDRAMQAYRLGRRLVLFADVDVGSMVERKVEGRGLPYHTSSERPTGRARGRLSRSSTGRRQQRRKPSPRAHSPGRCARCSCVGSPCG